MEKRTAVGLTIVLAVTAALVAQNPAIKRTVVTRGDISVPGREAVITNIEIMMEGHPALKIKPGDGFIVPGGTKHDAHNTGTEPLKLIGIYVVEKGKPLATPAP
jgi:hypothetical protein